MFNCDRCIGSIDALVGLTQHKHIIIMIFGDDENSLTNARPLSTVEWTIRNRAVLMMMLMLTVKG